MIRREVFLLGLILFTIISAASPCRSSAGAEAGGAKKKIVFLPGRPSHGWGQHAHRADCHLLARLLNQKVPQADAAVIDGGWPQDTNVLQDAAAVIIVCDGNNLLGPTENYQTMDTLAAKGVGLGFMHYSLDVGNKARGQFMLRWIGGYYEQHWSVNPFWLARFEHLPDHPITRGVRPFEMLDEWYYHMRFADRMEGVTPILTAIPPDKTRTRRDGPHSGNSVVRSRLGMPEHVAWAYERAGGGRGFGFTGGHSHWNLAQDDVRTLLLNAACWLAHIDIPHNGIPSATPTSAEMEAHLVGERPEGWTMEKTQQAIDKARRQH